MKCIANSVLYVKEIMSRHSLLGSYRSPVLAIWCAGETQKGLDKLLIRDRIILTQEERYSGDLVNAQQGGQKVQARGPQAARNSQSASGRGNRPPVRNVTQSATAFGFSRPTYYQAEADFQRDGLFGLLPEKRGPRKGHKLTPEVLDFVVQLRASDPSLRPLALAAAIRERFAINAHPRSLERALKRREKKRR